MPDPCLCLLVLTWSWSRPASSALNLRNTRCLYVFAIISSAYLAQWPETLVTVHVHDLQSTTLQVARVGALGLLHKTPVCWDCPRCTVDPNQKPPTTANFTHHMSSFEQGNNNNWVFTGGVFKTFCPPKPEKKKYLEVDIHTIIWSLSNVSDVNKLPVNYGKFLWRLTWRRTAELWRIKWMNTGTSVMNIREHWMTSPPRKLNFKLKMVSDVHISLDIINSNV